MENKIFDNEFHRVVDLINKNDSFVFVRYGDGEVILMNNGVIDESTQAFRVDKWKASGSSKLGEDLRKSMENKDWYYGIPCECCNLACKNYLLSLLDVPDEQITYANLWVNSNYKLFIDWVKTLTDVVLMVNHNANENLDKFPFSINEFYPIQDDCVNYYEDNKDQFISEICNLATKHNSKTFLISAGPLSEVIIHYMYQANKNNKYIDVGSSLDEYTHNKITRPYMVNGNMYNLKKCVF